MKRVILQNSKEKANGVAIATRHMALGRAFVCSYVCACSCLATFAVCRVSAGWLHECLLYSLGTQSKQASRQAGLLLD